MTTFVQRTQKPQHLALFVASALLAGCQHFSLPMDEPAPRITPANNSSAADKSDLTTTPAPTAAHLAAAQKIRQAQLAQSKAAQDPNNLTAWQAIAKNPGLTEPYNERITAQKKWYLEHPAFLSQVLGRSDPFIGYVINEAQKRDIPLIVALLPIVESRYDPHAISKAGAVGPWQFMPATAAHFGLKMNWWYDGRRDIITSTDAALTYLDQLQMRFDGDWLLALASYNVGGGNVNKAIRLNKSKGLPIDYWSLTLPRETSEYVPRLFALLEIIENAENYGVDLPNIASVPKVKSVHTLGQIDVARAAQLADMSEEEFRTLNPGLRRWASDPQGPFTVLVPSDKAHAFATALKALPAHQKITWHQHKVKPGDTISQIANAYQVPTNEFKRINKLSSSFIRVGQALLVPKPTTLPNLNAKQQGKTATSQIVKLKSVNHEVKAGDTLWDISRQYNISIRNIAAENNIPTRGPLKIGKILTLTSAKDTANVSSAHESSAKVNYKVKAGDSLYGIARQFKVSIGDIASWNALDKSNHIRPGQELTLFLQEES